MAHGDKIAIGNEVQGPAHSTKMKDNSARGLNNIILLDLITFCTAIDTSTRLLSAITVLVW